LNHGGHREHGEHGEKNLIDSDFADHQQSIKHI